MRITFPHMGNLWLGLKTALQELGQEVIVSPKPSKRTLTLGSQYSPEFACLPLKINLGCFLEAIEQGADTILMAGGVGPCRFGYYGAVQQRILEDMGYKIDFVIIDPPQGRWKEFLADLRKVSGGKSLLKILSALRFGIRKLEVMDYLEKLGHKIRAREVQKGATDRILEKTLKRLDEASSYKEVKRIKEEAKEEMLAIPREHFTPLKVVVTGEIFVVLEPFVNMDVERELGRMGVEVERTLFITDWVREHLLPNPKAWFKHKYLEEKAKPYLGHFVGGDGQLSVASACIYAEKGFDGMVHLMPFTCMPEIIAQSILPRVSADLSFPVLTLVFDEHTGKAGVLTRLEAFVDLLQRKRVAKAI